MQELDDFRAAALREVTENVLPFSMRYALDREHGGFYGYVANDRRVEPQAPKGLVQHSRMLWTFAQASRILGNPEYRHVASHAYTALMDWFWDRQHGGFFWEVDYRGRPLQTVKFLYGQAFALYALAEQHRAGGEARCLEQAIELYRLLEARCRDREYEGYWEAYHRDWTPAPEQHVDPTPLPVAKGMNTHLHLLEAYANLLRSWDDADLRASLRTLIHTLLHYILSPSSLHLALFFDREWRALSDQISYGHDIEASWLLVEAAEILGEPELLFRAQVAAVQMAYAVLEEGLDADGGVYEESESAGLDLQAKTWWPQAEAMVGFLNAYQLNGDPYFLRASLDSWALIRRFFIDREHGEWFHTVDGSGRPLDREKIGSWKTPYHSSRACLEIAERVTKMAR